MIKFQETHNLPKLNEEKIENLYRPITSNETESVIKQLPINKIPGPEGFMDQF